MNTKTSRRARRALTATAVVAGLVATTAVVGIAAPATASVPQAAPSAPAEAGRSSFVLPVLPDTQFYSRYSESQFYPKYDTNPFEVQTEWIVEHQDELNVPFVAHVGDVVDQEWVTGEWNAAAKAMRILTDGGVPYSVVPGNHDVANSGARSSEASSWQYLQRFDAARMAEQGGDTFVGSYQNGLSTAYIFEAEGHRWMSLALAWNASDDTFTWAQSILDAHPGVPVVLSSHAIINIAEDQVSPADWWWGEELWNRIIRSNEQIVVTLNGHFHGTTMRERTNDAGLPVYQILTDYQMAADGGNGYMTMLEFDLTNDRIDVESVSPWITRKDPASRTSADAPYLDGPWQSFSIDIDFDERFGYAADPALETRGDLSERAKQIVSVGWDGGNGNGQLAPAGRADDYIAVPGTVAHWRFGQVAEGIVDDHTVIPDVAGDSPMFRNAIEHTDSPEELDDVQITHSNVPFYSADAGASCFTDVHRNAVGIDNLSYLSTEYGAPATFADLTSASGYTIETFLQMDEAWTETANRWGAALTRGGARQWIGINDTADAKAGAAWLGISNLREYQFSAGDTDTRNQYTLWSGEIMQGAWHHVAIVNDPVADTAIMYVDGVPVLRNASNVGGMMAADFMPWIIGASTSNTEANHGWFGCIGETRVVDHALDADQFLTQRVDIDGMGANFAVTTDLASVRAHDAQVAELTGTGHPGAAVRVTVAGAAAGSSEVAADGTWSIALSSPIAGTGAHALSFVQSIGTRDGVAREASLVIGEAPAPWAPVESDLDATLEGAIQVSPNPFSPGETVTVSLPAGHDGDTVYAFVFSQPTAIGAQRVDADRVSFTTPASLPFGAHRFALYTADGALIGWDSVSVVDPNAVAPLPDAGSATPGGGLAATGGSANLVLLWVAVAAAAIAGGITLRLRRRPAA